jgi:LPXTG-site transpeptidase (sortase) family protein
MPRRPLQVGGLVAILVGALLLSLGLGRGREEPAPASLPTAAAPSRSVASPEPSPSEVSAPANTPPLEVATPTLTPTPTPTPTRAVRKAVQGASPEVAGPSTSGLHLGVAAIGLTTALRSGGVSASGTINPPAGQARWVRGFGRVQPGKVGTAVVAGHVVSSGDPDVFARLSSVRVGNKVVVRSGSVTRTYVVTRTAVVKKSALTHDADVWGQNTSKRRIVLITCDDELGYRSDGHRVANYVVVADAV